MSSAESDLKPNYLYIVLNTMYKNTKCREKKEAYAKIMNDMTKRYTINPLEQSRYYKQVIENTESSSEEQG